MMVKMLISGLVSLINHPAFSLIFQNQPLITYGRPRGDSEVRMVSSVDKRKQDRWC